MRGWKICKIFRINIELHVSLVVLAMLIMVASVTGVLMPQVPNQPLILYLLFGFLMSALFLFSIVFHEMAHSLVARKFGVEVKRITLFMLGGVAQLGQKTKKAKEEFFIALAGPLSSLLLAGIFWALASFVHTSMLLITVALSYLAIINFILAVFNLLPGYPMDGGRVLRGILWFFTNELTATRWAVGLGKVIAAFMVGFGIFLVIFAGNWGGIWLAFIGWFLLKAANAEYAHILIEYLGDEYSAKDAMRPLVFDKMCKSSDSLKDVAKKMKDLASPTLYVTDNDDKVIGSITIAELIEYLKLISKEK